MKLKKKLKSQKRSSKYFEWSANRQIRAGDITNNTEKLLIVDQFNQVIDSDVLHYGLRHIALMNNYNQQIHLSVFASYC